MILYSESSGCVDRGTINLKRHFIQEIMIFIQASYWSGPHGRNNQPDGTKNSPHHMALGHPFIWEEAAKIIS